MKHDLKKDRKDLYRPSTKDFELVDVPAMVYLAFDGHGDPNEVDDYQTAIECLYPAAYAVRAALKARTGDDFVVGPLEGLWSAADPADFVATNKSNWDWTMLIPMPDVVTDDDMREGLETATKKKRGLPMANVYRLELTEGPSLQIMHVGSYDDEAPTLARLHSQVMPDGGWTFNGRHHEIYLSDPRRTEPVKLQTVLRQPVAKRDA